MIPEGFDVGYDRILLEQQYKDVTQVLWTDRDTSILRITQQWEDGEEVTIHLTYRELEEIAAVASGRYSVQRHEDYLDAQDRHNDAMGRY